MTKSRFNFFTVPLFFLIYLLAANMSYAEHTSSYTFQPDKTGVHEVAMRAYSSPSAGSIDCSTKKGEAYVKKMDVIDKWCSRFKIKSKEGGPIINRLDHVILTSKDQERGCQFWYSMVIHIASMSNKKTAVIHCVASQAVNFSWNPVN